jgi:hypothetical protein
LTFIQQPPSFRVRAKEFRAPYRFFLCGPSRFFQTWRYFVQTQQNLRLSGIFNAAYIGEALRRDSRGLIPVIIKLNVAVGNQKAHGGELLIQRHKSWIHSQPTSDEAVAPLDYLRWKNKESLARWRDKVNALAAAGNYPYPNY